MRAEAKCSVRTGTVNIKFNGAKRSQQSNMCSADRGKQKTENGGSQRCSGRKRLKHYYSDDHLNIYFESRALCPPFLHSITDSLSSVSLFFLCLFYYYYNGTIFLGKILRIPFPFFFWSVCHETITGHMTYYLAPVSCPSNSPYLASTSAHVTFPRTRLLTKDGKSSI